MPEYPQQTPPRKANEAKSLLLHHFAAHLNSSEFPLRNLTISGQNSGENIDIRDNNIDTTQASPFEARHDESGGFDHADDERSEDG